MLHVSLQGTGPDLDANLWSTRLDRHLHPVGAPVRLTNDSGVIFSVSASSDSKRILYVKGIPEPDVYVADLQSSFGKQQVSIAVFDASLHLVRSRRRSRS
jgi:hypothetical protein